MKSKAFRSFPDFAMLKTMHFFLVNLEAHRVVDWGYESHNEQSSLAARAAGRVTPVVRSGRV